ncbi:MAG TPA: hypothetical protein VGW57_10245 [Chthoniobacterales bacterium]|nr:hypothetical protein [Chthoniobacterales bacterium]
MLPQLDDNARLVLRTVAERDMDGYTLARRTKLERDVLEKAVQDLQTSQLLRVKGEPVGPGLLEAWFQAVPGAMRMLSVFQ